MDRLAGELNAFLQFRRSLGYRYRRAEFTLRDFDRFLSKYVSKNRHWRLDQAILAWLSSKPKRKAVSVSNDAAVLRQFFAYLRRLPSHKPLQEPLWPRLPTESCFVPYFLSEQDIRRLLALCAHLKRPVFRAKLYRALLLVLYCTGVRFGEALQSPSARCGHSVPVFCLLRLSRDAPGGFRFIDRCLASWSITLLSG